MFIIILKYLVKSIRTVFHLYVVQKGRTKAPAEQASSQENLEIYH